MADRFLVALRDAPPRGWTRSWRCPYPPS